MPGCGLPLPGWSAAALTCQPQDAWIGWSQFIQWQCLQLIVNHSRFLILSGIPIPNLASKILSFNLKPLSSDRQDIYGHPVLHSQAFSSRLTIY
jgi:hypothetical protein